MGEFAHTEFAFILTPIGIYGTIAFVRFSAGILTFWVPFSTTNRSPCRKKSILAKVCFDAKRG